MQDLSMHASKPLFPLAGAAALVAALAPMAPAQVPPHHAVVSTVSVPGFNAAQRGVTGIYVVPLPTSANPAPRTPTPITGLPADLRIPAGTFGGTSSLWLSPDGSRLLASNYAAGPAQVQLHVLDLAGTAVQPSSRSFQVGTVRSGFGQGAGAIQRLPDGRFLVNLGGPAAYLQNSGPGSQSSLGILDLDGPNPGITPVPLLAPMSGFPSAMVLSPDSRIAYQFTQAGGGTTPCDLYEIDVDSASPTFGAVTLLHVFHAGVLHQPVMRSDGRIVGTASNISAFRDEFVEIDTTVRPVGVTSTPVPSTGKALFGPFNDQVSGAAVYTSLAQLGSSNTQDVWIAPSGPLSTPQVLATEPAAGWGFPYAAAIRESMQTYGSANTATSSHQFDVASNAGGLPELGNAGFELRVTSATTAPIAAWTLLGAAPAAQQVAGLDILVQPLAGVRMSIQGLSARLPLPIPNHSGLLGATLYAQPVVIDAANGLVSSDALRIGLIR